jgi:hypothetical protein
MMSGILPLGRLERRPAALGWVLRVVLSNTVTGDAKRPPRTKISVIMRRFVRLPLAQRLDCSPRTAPTGVVKLSIPYRNRL